MLCEYALEARLVDIAEDIRGVKIDVLAREALVHPVEHFVCTVMRQNEPLGAGALDNLAHEAWSTSHGHTAVAAVDSRMHRDDEPFFIRALKDFDISLVVYERFLIVWMELNTEEAALAYLAHFSFDVVTARVNAGKGDYPSRALEKFEIFLGGEMLYVSPGRIRWAWMDQK